MLLILGRRPKECHHTCISLHFSRCDHPCSKHGAYQPPQTHISDRLSSPITMAERSLRRLWLAQLRSHAYLRTNDWDQWGEPSYLHCAACVGGWAGPVLIPLSGIPIRKSHRSSLRRGGAAVNMEIPTGDWSLRAGMSTHNLLTYSVLVSTEKCQKQLFFCFFCFLFWMDMTLIWLKILTVWLVSFSFCFFFPPKLDNSVEVLHPSADYPFSTLSPLPSPLIAFNSFFWINS